MKTSELIKKLQQSLEENGDLEVKCELYSTNKWYSESENLKSLNGKLGKFYNNKNYIIIRV